MRVTGRELQSACPCASPAAWAPWPPASCRSGEVARDLREVPDLDEGWLHSPGPGMAWGEPAPSSLHSPAELPP